jgi:hypothetical protein
MIKAKISADIDIFKNRKIIEKKYEELEKVKIIPDKVIIKQFSDTIFIPDDISKELAGKIFNKILGYISNKAKKRLLSS